MEPDGFSSRVLTASRRGEQVSSTPMFRSFSPKVPWLMQLFEVVFPSRGLTEMTASGKGGYTVSRQGARVPSTDIFGYK